MPAADITNQEFQLKGECFCAGGMHPEPPVDRFPLLAWSQHHHAFGKMVVHTEDQKASVHDIAVAFAATPSLEAVAAKFGTSVEHADQAVRYADEWRKLHTK